METQSKSGLSKFAKALIVLLVVAAIAFLAAVSSVAGAVGRMRGGGGLVPGRKPHLTLLKVEGAIFESEKILAGIARIRDDRQCKGVLLRVDSPGGAVGASQEVFAALRGLRERGLP